MKRRKPLRWRKTPRPTGLARVCAGPQGMQLRIGSDVLAWIAATRQGDLWYWVATAEHYGVPLKNTCKAPTTFEQAKTQAEAYVRQHLGVRGGV